MDQNQELALAQMRRAVHNLGSSTEGYGDVTLTRFLIARSFDIDKAAKMFVQWRDWRASFVPLNYIPESEIPDELSGEKIYLQGLTTKGHPLAIVKANKHFPSKDALQFKKFVVHLLDKTIARHWPGEGNDQKEKDNDYNVKDELELDGFRGKEVGNEKLIAILDLQQVGYKNVDARGLITGFQFLQAYYPERLAKCYLLHMPGFFVRVWRLVSRFLEKATLEKIVIVMNEEERQEFIRDIGEEVLPEEYGGKAKLILLQDFEVKPLDD